MTYGANATGPGSYAGHFVKWAPLTELLEPPEVNDLKSSLLNRRILV
jgi:hypothetical protein